MDTCQTPQSSGISEHSLIQDVPAFIEGLRISFQRVSPVSHFLSPGNVLEKWTRAICGLKPYAVFKSSDPNLSFSKMSLASSPPNPRYAYVAGLLDGEGCIGIQSSNAGQNFCLEITIGMSEKALPLLRAVHAEMGGTIGKKREATEKWEASVRWRIGGQGAHVLLKKISPYLLLKAPQAEVAEELEKIVQELKPNPNGSKKWTSEARAKAQSLKQKMHELNAKGPNAKDAGGWYLPSPNLFVIWERFSGTFPRSGMMLGGKLYQRESWERRIGEIGCGLWRSPGSSDGEGGVMEMREGTAGKYKLRDQVEEKNRKFWPTPRAGKITDEDEESWRARKDAGDVATPPLTLAVKMWPTPAGRDWRSGKSNDDPRDRLNEVVTAMAGHDNAALSPDWVGWLMGWVIGWESLSPLPREDFENWKTRILDGLWWTTDPADDGSVPRLTNDKTDRVSRLKALGNSQVPAVVRAAWEVLTED